MKIAEALERLETDAERGLSESEAKRRLAARGPNELKAARRVSPWTILLAQLKNVLIAVLLAAVGLSAFLGDTLEAAVIAAIALLAVLLGFVQEYRAERAIEALREMAAPTATVVRGGAEREVPARDLVPGDILLLQAGNRVPADARLIAAVNLKAEESALTGESAAVEKISDPLPGDAELADRTNMVWAGTAVTYGRGRAAVATTGMGTEFGRIARMLEAVEEERTPLQRNLDRVGRMLAWAGLAVVLLVMASGLLRGQPFLEMLVFGIALAVAVVPEALPAVVTISLALGVQRMVKRHVLVRRLPAVETLGSVSVIGSDKTGTLTRDEMTVRHLSVAGQAYEVTGAGYAPAGSFLLGGREVELPEPLLELLRAAALASDADLVRDGEPTEAGAGIHGDPTEGALVVAAAKAGLDKRQLDARFPRVGEIPFTSESKRMTTLHAAPEGTVAFAKGAPEGILAASTRRLGAAGEEPLDAAGREVVLAEAQSLAASALRVLAIARKTDASPGDAEQGLTFLGLAGMIDPPRPEAKAAILTCERAGIKPLMITGDHPVTAEAIARELGVLRSGRAVTGAEIDRMDDAELAREVETFEVCARVSPAHKLRIVTALQARGHSVAMTGDGVNDAPALKKADIGIAMGVTGTDVTKEAADMTLTDDNFASIVAAVEEGRGVFDNIKKYLMFLLSSNIGEIGLMAGASLAGLPLPLSAVQILYVNLATDGLPALALAVDPPENDAMERPPRDPHRGFFTRPIVSLLLVGGIWSALVNLGLFAWALGSGRPLREAMTMTFVLLVLIQLYKAYNYRSDRRSVLRRPFANRWLNLAVAWELSLLAVVVYLPAAHDLFGTNALPFEEWLLVNGLAATIVPVLESAKWMERRGWLGRMD
ncbi:MAG TPA: cation-translocating P-type ATPase [Thermoanaerobaculia bacterium]|nr:cation-translocating P-type ATPase [Thermoanaerobaculia bacterium]